MTTDTVVTVRGHLTALLLLPWQRYRVIHGTIGHVSRTDVYSALGLA